MLRLLVATALLSQGDALKCGLMTTRRAAVAGLFGLPACASAANPLDFSEGVVYKERNYGDMPTVDTKPPAKAGCPEGTRKTPDGFGGTKCVDKVKSVPGRIFSGDESSPPPPPPPPVAAAAPKKSIGESTSSSSGGALSLDELVANSIAQKETFLGRPLTDQEKRVMTEKVKALMGA